MHTVVLALDNGEGRISYTIIRVVALSSRTRTRGPACAREAAEAAARPKLGMEIGSDKKNQEGEGRNTDGEPHASPF